MYEYNVTIDDIIKIMDSNHRSYDKDKIIDAYNYAYSKHGDQKRKSGESYICHPLRVARFIATWGFRSDMIIAAMLHDVVEDCHTSIQEINQHFGVEVGRTVDAVTNLDKDLKESLGLTKEQLDHLSDVRLQQSMHAEAFYIKVADRLDNLHTIYPFPKHKQMKKAKHTTDILVPIARRVKAYKLVDDLECLCFKIEHEDDYRSITTNIREYNDKNKNYIDRKTRMMFVNAFEHNQSIDPDIPFPESLVPFQKYISSFEMTPRSEVSIYRHITAKSQNIRQDYSYYLKKQKAAYYDMTLIFKDSIRGDNALTEELTPYNVVFEYFKDYFSKYDCTILNYIQTTDEGSCYFLLSDEMSNLYRLFIRTETEYLKYQLGEVVDTDTDINFVDVNAVDPRDTYKPKIKIFRRNGASESIDENATVLDFAFKLGEQTGLHFDYAIVNDNEDIKMGPDYTLRNGDLVVVHTSEDVTATFHWINYLKTSLAKRYLAKYFEKQFGSVASKA